MVLHKQASSSVTSTISFLKIPACITLWTCVLLSFSLVRGADPFAPGDITVTDTTLASNIEPIGANLTTISGGTNFAVNNLIRNSGYEPMVLRKFVRINRLGHYSDHDYFEWDQEGGPSYWNLAWTGLFNGATVRFYRIVDNAGQPLSYSNGSDMSDIEGADHVIFIGETTIPLPGGTLPDGGYIANTDIDGDTDNDMERAYIEADDLNLQYGDYAYIKLKTRSMGAETSPPDLNANFQGLASIFSTTSGSWQPELVSHPAILPSSFTEPGETCLKITLPNSETVRLGQWVYHPYDDGEGQWYSQLRPGTEYRVSVWMRQEGLANDGKARFTFNGAYDSVSQTEHWELTDQWQQFTYDFIAPDYPTSGSHIAHRLEFTGPGEVWIDNFVLYRNDASHDYRPFGPHENSLAKMLESSSAEGKKPAMRFYGTIFHPSTIEAMFTDYANPSYRVAWNAGIGSVPDTTIAQVMNWAYKSGDNPATRFVPYLTCNEEYTEEEWMALVEYLGVPYDPAVDTPTAKPYAYLRYKYRNGNGDPWTDEFREILVEYGNETWHNGAGGYGWHGWGRPGYVHQGGMEYGLFARYMFDEQVMQMAEWSRYNLGDKIKFTLGGNYSASDSSYVEKAVQQGATISYAGHANYVGPKWETGDDGTDYALFDDHGVQMTLLGMYKSMKTLIEQAQTTQRALNSTAGTDYKIIAYEGGPSGYWTNTGDDQEIDELYGKSVAMGVAALDCWLYSSLHGYTYQDYLGFSSGKWWSSHTPPEAGGFRAHPGWLGLTMRNRYVPGSDMVKTLVNSSPTMDSDGEEIPLLSSYSIKGENSYAVFVLSRKLDGNHDGENFGDGYTPVSLHLPFSEVNSITRYRLESPDGSPVDPRLNNRDDLQVVIGAEEIDLANFSENFIINQDTGGEDGGIPPGSINLFVFQLAGDSTPTLADAISLLQVFTGGPVDIGDTAVSDINGDNKIGIAEVINVLGQLSNQQ